MFAGDGRCDDGGPGAEYSNCAEGTDCIDCGTRLMPPAPPKSPPEPPNLPGSNLPDISELIDLSKPHYFISTSASCVWR